MSEPSVPTLALLTTSIDGNFLPAVLPEISKDFDLNVHQGGWINKAFFGGTVAGASFFGGLSDKIGSGYRRSLTWNIAMIVGILGGALTFGFAGSFMAFLLRIPMGISAIIDHFGFTTRDVVLAAICLLGLYPLSKMTETVNRDHLTAHTAGAGAI